MARTTRSSAWPMFTHINWLLKSRYRLPSGVQKYTPFARATGSGSNVPCGDHSKIVCFFESRMISSDVMRWAGLQAALHLSRASFQKRASAGFAGEGAGVDDNLPARDDGVRRARDLAAFIRVVIDAHVQR